MSTNEQTLEFTATERGFGKIKFTDRYGLECSVQKSSLATEDCIWFGVEDSKPMIMKSQAKELGFVVDGPVEGWMPYPIPKGVLIHSSMHLSQKQVQELLPVLTHFANTGELPESL